MTNSAKTTSISRSLGDGLVLRSATIDDTEALVEFNSRVHSDDGWDQPNAYVGTWTRDLLTKNHPAFQPGDFTIVEDTRTGEIVSSLNLISQTWAYEGIPFGVGRPELVGTHPDYRNRGLVRAQFELIHEWSQARAELVQAITGIPYYYRIFGYEMAMDLGGGKIGFPPYLPKLKEGQSEPFNIRHATRHDLPFIDETYCYGGQRNLVTCLRDEKIWCYELESHDPKSVNGRSLMIIETPEGQPVGFLALPSFLWGGLHTATIFELKPGVSWVAVTPSVVRYIYKAGQELASQEENAACNGYRLALGGDHPAYHAAKNMLPRTYDTYAWYLRVPDLLAFLRHIKPALEKRLAGSIACGHTGEIKLTFYRSGLRMVFASGQITGIEPWQPHPVGHRGDAAFPELTFLQLLFGYRNLDELEYAFADCWAETDEARTLLNALFPKKTSDIWPIQ